MCRIAGIVSKRLPIDDIRQRVQKMCDVLKHGGPDDEGIFADGKLGLVFGHRRLAIIDLSVNGHQPMADVKQRAWITFNGEIYNYVELKRELVTLGATFHSDTDTEVILAAYLKWGTSSFIKFRGMFAFALYDVAASVTYLVRGTNGIKPLYYHTGNEQLSFASEVKALKAGGINEEDDPAWSIRFLAFGHIPEPYTTVKNIYSLPKGHYLRWNHQDNTHQICSFNRPPATPYINDAADAQEQIRALLKAAIKRQLISDAAIGVFLSGGIDSSLITLLSNEEQLEQLKTISIFFDEKAYDERVFQKQVLDKIKGEKFAHLVQQRDFEQFFPAILSDMDLPTTDGINTWFISKYAHEDGLKAVLSGVGADELFGGYPSFNRIKYLNYFRRIPSGLFAFANFFQTDRYRKISFLVHDHPLADYLLLRGLYVPDDIARLLDTDTRQVYDVLFNNNDVPELGSYNEEHAAWFETNLYMQNQLLRDTDVMSMSHGLEVRVPFLDEDFKFLAESIAPAIRFNSKQPKKLLIDSFTDILPPTIWQRPKMGFTFPLQQWMSQHEQIADPSFYRGDMSKAIIKKFKNNQMHWSKVFALYQIQLHG